MLKPNPNILADNLAAGYPAPILYLPMRDADTAHINNGTGGDFVPNGTLDTAQRGANQNNCVQSLFDNTDDSMTKTGFGGVGSKQLLLSVNTKAKESATLNIVSTRPITLQHLPASQKFSLRAYNSANTLILSVDIPISSTSIGVEYSLQVSLDLTSTATRSVYLNGVDVTGSCTWLTYTNDNIDYGYTGSFLIGTAGNNQEIGELYIDSDYSSNNPFWDATLNKPKPVRQVLEETGNTPLIAMPISADNPTKNYGTGGDFTLNGGGLTGARGSSEYISRSIVVDGTKYLTGNVFCQSLVKWKSIDSGATWTATYANAVTVTNIGNGTDNGHVSFYWGTSENINWSLEESKLRVTDQLGFPKDLYKIVADNPNTVLALPFDDSTDFGKNLVGTDFTVVGAVVSGADVTA